MGILIVCLILFISYVAVLELILKYYKKQKIGVKLYCMLYKLIVVVVGSIWLAMYMIYLFHKWGNDRAIVIVTYIVGVMNYIQKTNDIIETEYIKNRTLRVERCIIKR